MKKHISQDVWSVKALVGAAAAGSAYFYLGGITPADVVASIV